MRVEIDPEVFRAHDIRKPEVQAVFRLLETFDVGRHDWVIDPFDVDDFAAFLPSHFPSLAESYAAMARLASKREAAWTGNDQHVSIVVDTDNLVDLAADLSQSAVVVVEDLPSDGDRFLGTLIEVFGPERLRQAYREGWFEVVHSGGTGRMPDVAAAAVRRFLRLIRVVAFLDSDRLTMDAPGNADKVEKLAGYGAHVHLLAWREAENYVPDAVLRKCVSRAAAARTLHALHQLRPHQRAVYDMKHGFREGVPPAQRDVFADLDEAVLEVLRDGFGRNVLVRLSDLRSELAAADFEAVDRGAAADLRALLEAIDRLV
ncbi:hypothetical protein [Actinoplanes sp. DH11]|uniref:hypothetical protein n=1 Tax=Actinoplanes sp. DH11 TaxID=2857011 RepID=UPI001E4DA4E9|nr:hypothetical protein [Actinoplanes sp. DH11]